MKTTLHEGSELHASDLATWLLDEASHRLLILMGLPASGKSTLAEHLEKRGAARINRDAIRKRLYGDESVMGDTTVVNKEYYKDLRAAFGKGGPVISDNVNITLFHRKGSIAAARDHGYTDIVIVWVDVPLEVAIERNAKRDRKVDEQVIRDMHADLMKYPDGPRADEGALLVLQNGKDKEHYKVHRVRAAAPAPTTDAPNTTTPSAPSTQATGAVPSGAFALASDLRKQVSLFDACIAAGRTEWAGLTLSVIRQLSESGASLFTVTPTPAGTTPGAPAKRPPAAKKPVNATPEEINEQLLKMLAGRPPVAGDGPLVALCFNGHLLTKEKAEKLILPLTELFKRAHVIFVQETNVDALRVIAKAMRYGLNASHRNAREQACGILYHPRLHWLGKAPFYHDYLLDVPGHPEYKATLRPALQRRVRDLATGVVYDFVNFHGKSNLGGPDQTRPTRLWQFQAMADEFERQRTKSPYQAREAVRALPGGTEAPATESKGLVDNTGWDLPVGAIILGGDYNAPIENPATTETAPMFKAGFRCVSTPDLRWSYQYRGSGGQFDGFFVRGLDGLVSECFIPEMPVFKTRESVLYGEISDHMPVFMTVQAPAKAETGETQPEVAATQPTAVQSETPANSGAPKTDAA